MVEESRILEMRSMLSPAKRALLERRLRGGLAGIDPTLAITRRTEPGPAPLSFGQQQLWFIDQVSPGNSSYNVYCAWSVKGMLNVVALEQTLGEIVRRHEALRTTFQSVNGRPIQVVGPAEPVTVSVKDMSGLSEAEREDQVKRATALEIQRSFDLATGPLLRTTLLKLEELEHIFIFTSHHIISDGWSVGVMGKEIKDIFETFWGGSPSLIYELPIQYADFAAWQHQWLRGEALGKYLDYWRDQLQGITATLAIPTDFPRPKVQTFRGAVYSFTLPATLTLELERLSHQENVTLFMTLLSAFKVLLGRYAGASDIVVGTNVANRKRRETEHLIGFFVNNLVLRTSLDGNPTVRQLLNRVRDVCLEAFAHQDLPFEMLVGDLKPDRSLSYNPIFQVLFVLQNYPFSNMSVHGLKLKPLELRGRVSRFDLMLNVERLDNELTALLEYNTDLFQESTIKRMGMQFQALLEKFSEDPGREIDRLSLTRDREKRQLISTFNDPLE